MLVDNVDIEVRSGDGGAGLVSFRKEKFKPFGGPDGGDGGKGGNVLVMADEDVKDLSAFRHKAFYKAKSGETGGSNKMHGSNAEDVFIKVPTGTSVYVKEDGGRWLLADLTGDGQVIKVVEGGKGGRGNVHFATATRKAPRMAQPGMAGQEIRLELQMKLPVDVAIIGLPNCGKSTLLSALSGARPQVADYPFTTREPVLGMVDRDLKRYAWAELPALVEGSHEGRGLGNQQLKHAERAKALIYLIDISSEEAERELEALVAEIKSYDQGLAGKAGFIVLNKADLITPESGIDSRKITVDEYGWPVHVISAREGTGLDELVRAVHAVVGELKKAEKQVEEEPLKVFRPEPVDRRRKM